MPLKGDAKKVFSSMLSTYGGDKEKAERVFYATANKQKRKPETWKKKSAQEKLAAILDELPDPAYEAHLAKMAAMGAKIAALQPRKMVPTVAGIPPPKGQFEFVDPQTQQKPALAATQPAGRPTKTAAPIKGPMGNMTAPAKSPVAPPASSGTPIASTVASTTTNMPGTGMMVTASVPRAKTASHADLLKMQFQALRLSGVLAEV